MFVAALLLTAALAVAGWFPQAGFDNSLFPVEMVAELKRAGVAPEGPVFTPDIWGGYLILEWPRARVFVDARWDMRGDAFYERYADILLARPAWSRLLKETGVNWVVVPPDVPLAPALRSSSEWRLWKSDSTAMVFRREPNSHPDPASERSLPRPCRAEPLTMS